MKYFLYPFLIILLIIPNCSQLSTVQENSISDENWVEQTLQSMTLDQKIGQMILMTFGPNYMSDSSKVWQTIRENIIKKHVFGYHIWRGDIYAARHYIRKMQEMADIPLIFSADFERGVGLKFDGAVEFPPNMAFGATGNSDYVYQLGAYTAIEGQAIGFSLVFAPVADVSNNPDNPIVNTRSFGESPKLVSRMVTSFIEGAHEHNFGAVVKHFPGHGNTDFDSHIDLATIYSSREEIESTELAPFREAVKTGVDMIMTAHIYVPDLEETPGVPATLSKSILTDLLRNEMKYDGVIISDAMGMGGIKNNFTERYATVSAINAGCDLLINNGINAEYTFDSIKEAVNKGLLSEVRIDSSVRRLLTLKMKLGLHNNRFMNMDSNDQIIGLTSTHKLAQEVADKAVTLIKDDAGLLPVKTSVSDFAIINLHDVNTRHEANRFQSEMLKLYPRALIFNLDLTDDAEDYSAVLDTIADNATVVIGAFIRYGAYKGHVELSTDQADFMKQLQQKTQNIIVYSFGNPYILHQFSGISTYLCGFGWQIVCQKAAVKALSGQICITGKMPVSIPGIINFGEGLELTKNIEMPETEPHYQTTLTVRRGFPEEVHVNPIKMTAIEELLNQGVQDSAFPGGVFLAIKDGVIFEEYSFGQLSYDKKSVPVNNQTIYDLASLTKPIATTAAAMLLYDKGLLDLDERVTTTFPQFGVGGKESATIRNLLTHTSGLPPFIHLWKVADNPQAMLNYLFECEAAYSPGTETYYSCMGMITLHKVIEAKAGQSLDAFLTENLYSPLGMTRTFFNPPEMLWKNTAPTEFDAERGGIVQGKVHDENAYYLGGVSGNAGLFTTARDLSIFSQMLLNQGSYRGKQYFIPETVELFTKRQNIVDGSNRTLGWSMPSGKSSSGRHFSENSVGHTGFTGTSIWIDFDKNLAGILLTNRVHPTRDNQKIYDYRRQVYNLLQESLTDYQPENNPNVDY